ncbi:EutN/CcmL family microcompartment protein [bacterium]|nr:EutN/CcmL family microcompartment protein [bacterium]
MFIGKVIGTVVATQKNEKLTGAKFLIVAPLDLDNKPILEKYVVAKDVVGAGASETVLVVSGSSARIATGSTDTPIDAAIIAIIDEIKYDAEFSGK